MANNTVRRADLARLVAAGRVPRPTEDETQRSVVKALRTLGYTVFVTSRRPKRCPGCGRWPRSGGGDGASRGLPDLYVRHPSWPAGLAVGLEIKRMGRVRWSSAEQRAAWEAGDTRLVQCVEDALAAVREVEIQTGGAGACPRS